MIEGQGLFQLAARSQAAARFHALPRPKAQPAVHLTPAMQRDPKMQAFWQAAARKAAESVTISDDTLKRLDTARKSDNKEIAAEKFRQAKAKLQALRLQAQLAAATGDAKSLRRLAQEAAAAAREIATAARGLANGIAATATAAANTPAEAVAATADSPSPDRETADSAGATPGDPAAKTTDYTGPVPAEAEPKAWGKEALRKLGDDARQAIAQARGIIAFLANAARAQRKHQSDPEEEKYFNELQRSVGDAEQDLTAALGEAGQAIDAGPSPSDSGTTEVTTLSVTVSTLAIQETTLGASANFLV